MESIIKPGFKLNCHKRKDNPLFESHDPSMMWDPVSEMYYSYCTDTAITSEYKQGIPVRKSKDLVDFQFVGYALSSKAIEEGRDNGECEPTYGFWAPYVEYVESKKEYRMYYSATKTFGSSESKIWLAVSNSPEGPFENRGVVMDTWFTDDTYPNAIDAHVIDDTKGNKYLVYGSFFGGIFIKELDVVSGMPKDGNARTLGRRIAKKPLNSYIDGPEGASVIYKEGYYYLFFSYGWLGDDYDIRVGRSLNVKGPYLDYFGNNINEKSLGTKLAGSYQFHANKPWAGKDEEKWNFKGFRGPGHGVPFYDPKRKEYFFVHHVRDGADELCLKPSDISKRTSYKMHYMVVRRMIFLDGWPVFSPEPFAGESMKIIGNSIKNDGNWEWLKFEQMNNKIATSVKGVIEEDSIPRKLAVINCFDFENSCMVQCFTGYNKDGMNVWGKRID